MPRSFTTGLYTGEHPNAMWTASYRKGSLDEPGSNTHIHTSHTMKLSAGTHTMFWKLWLSGYTIQLHSGTITAIAMPCPMGGKLKAPVELKEGRREVTLAEDGVITAPDVGRPDMEVTIDQSGTEE